MREGTHDDFHKDRHRSASTTYMIYVQPTDMKAFYKMQGCLLFNSKLHPAGEMQLRLCSGNCYLSCRKSRGQKWHEFKWNPKKEIMEVAFNAATWTRQTWKLSLLTKHPRDSAVIIGEIRNCFHSNAISKGELFFNTNLKIFIYLFLSLESYRTKDNFKILCILSEKNVPKIRR